MMREVLMQDLLCAARALTRVPLSDRREACKRLFSEADVAAEHVRKTGAAHPRFGNGTLAAAAMGHPMAKAMRLTDAEFCHSMYIFLDVMLDRLSDAKA